MSLARFNIIVCVDKNGGISKDGEIPWKCEEDLRFFRNTTIGEEKNVVIMGRKTYQSIPEKFRPLPKRHNVVISTTLKQEENPRVSVYPSFIDALIGLGSQKKYQEVFVMGGEVVYNEAVRDYLYLCDKIYVTKLKAPYNCDQFFPVFDVEKLPLFSDPYKSQDFTRYCYSPKIVHEEYQYLELLKRTLEKGDRKHDRTGTGTLELFGERMAFDIRKTIPLFTTKQVWLKGIIEELLFFISGKTDTKILEEKKVNIWKDNTNEQFLRKHKLPYREGVMGPGYPHQLRYFGAEYTGPDEDYTGQGVDQLQQVIDMIKDQPNSRRLIISYWNPIQIEEMALPPCLDFIQFSTCQTGDDGMKWLDCAVYQRSMDSFLGGPFNVCSCAILTYMVGFLTGYSPRRLIYNIGSFHIYNNHIESVKKQIKRMPRPFPTLVFRRTDEIRTIDDFTIDDFLVQNYNPCSPLKGEMNA